MDLPSNLSVRLVGGYESSNGYCARICEQFRDLYVSVSKSLIEKIMSIPLRSAECFHSEISRRTQDPCLGQIEHYHHPSDRQLCSSEGGAARERMLSWTV